VSLRKRLTLIAGVSVGIAIVLAALIVYLVVRGQLRGQVDDTLKAQAVLVQQNGNFALDGGPGPAPSPNAGGRAPYSQIVATNGTVIQTRGGQRLPVNAADLHVASGKLGSSFEDVTVKGNHLRVFTFHDTASSGPPGQGSSPSQFPIAIQLARPLMQVDNILSHLRLILLLLCAGGIALAAGLGRLAARRVLAPLGEVAQAAQHIGETEDLTSRIRVRADDEVGQLATRFNSMLDRLESSRSALDESVRAQRQLVADASHELRTPVTSLRTNIEVLLAGGELEAEDRRRLLADVVEQSEELSALVGDLIELARGDEPAGSVEDVRLDRVVEDSVARAVRNSPDIRFQSTLAPVSVDGVGERLGRAVNNLLDNAAGHSDPGGLVEVAVDTSGVQVRDHGPGIAEQDLPYVFDRFFRGTSSRGHQGSGLGLAIVRQVTEQHGGSALAANAPGGGAVFTLRLSAVPAESDGQPPAPPEEGSAATPSAAERLEPAAPSRSDA
jgi:two-component system sensor histidine kinase MprB